MKKHVIIITLITILCTLSIIYNLSKIKPTSLTTKEITENYSYQYTVKDYKGRIAIYKFGKEIPIEIFEIYTDSLPSSDSKKIYQGINITDEKELQQVIEDFTG